MKTQMDYHRRTKIHSAAQVSGSHLSDATKAALGTLGALLLALSLLIAALVAGVSPALSQKVQIVILDVAAVAEGYRASKLIGANVTNDEGDDIGTIDDIIIGKDRVLYAILEVGGFLGLGAQLVAVSYESLTITDDGAKIELPGATKEELTKLPAFEYKS